MKTQVPLAQTITLDNREKKLINVAIPSGCQFDREVLMNVARRLRKMDSRRQNSRLLGVSTLELEEAVMEYLSSRTDTTTSDTEGERKKHKKRNKHHRRRRDVDENDFKINWQERPHRRSLKFTRCRH